uniref:Capsid protein n=1 Tax=Caloscypha fulgens partitivirus 8 TaxID=2778766 RepID=A0A7L8Y979_9VIRU|nr:capsid protein [Caloscypha fulgens partitivirus 8]
MPANSTNPFHRQLDKESGMNRTQTRKPAKSSSKPAPTQIESEDETFTDNEAEEFASAPVKDDTRRKKTTIVRSPNIRGAPKQQRINNQEADEDDIEEVRQSEPTTGSAQLFLLALARNNVQAPRSFLEPSEYIPSAGNMFQILQQVTNIIGENTYLFEICPGYNSMAMNLYYGFVYYFQLLRARDAVGQLTRLERRSLRHFENIGKPEAWPIATPMVGFIQALGSCESPDKMYSFIAPRTIEYKFTADKGLTGLSTIAGSARVPIIPAMQAILRNFGTDDIFYNDSSYQFEPIELPLSSTRTFLGLKDSAITGNDFHALVFNQCWNQPSETSEPIGNFTLGQRQGNVRRWRIPIIHDNADLTSLESFLFGDATKTAWIKQLLNMSAQVNRFFPGSTTLGSIPPFTTMETFTHVTYDKKGSARSRVANEWYGERTNWTVSTRSNYFGDQSNMANAAATSVSTLAHFTDKVTATQAIIFQTEMDGPYFVNESPTEITVPITQCDSVNQQDPTGNALELIQSNLYDNRGGRN